MVISALERILDGWEEGIGCASISKTEPQLKVGKLVSLVEDIDPYVDSPEEIEEKKQDILNILKTL